MSYFWGNVFDYFKDRRIAGVFFGTLLALGGTLIVGLILYQVVCAYDMQEQVIYSLPGLGLLILLWLARRIMRARAHRKLRYRISPLSRDEITKARSKLLKH